MLNPIVELTISGGPVMARFILASLLALAVFLARLLALRRQHLVPADLRRAVQEAPSRGRPGRALRRCDESDTPPGRSVVAGGRAARRPHDERLLGPDELQADTWTPVGRVVAVLDAALYQRITRLAIAHRTDGDAR